MDTRLIANVITPSRILKMGEVAFNEEGIITYVGERRKTAEGKVFEYPEYYVSPGFIDLHLHGGGGHDFMDATEEAFLVASRLHATHGTTSMLPTSLTCSDEELFAFFDVYRRAARENTEGSRMPGVHLEGPYFAKSQKGAQDERYIVAPRREHYEKILTHCPEIARWTIAAELEGGMELGRYLAERGVVASLGHTDAMYDDALVAIENGYTLLTHFYSGMSGLVRKNSYRFPGLIDAGYMLDFDVEIIADGHHLPISLLNYIYRAKGPDKVALTTDSLRGAGMPDGDSILGSLKNGQRCIIEDGVCKMPDRLAFAGSVATTDRLVRNMYKKAGVPLNDAVKMASATPARIMGWKDRGVLTEGRLADLLVFDDDVNDVRTIIGGRTVFEQ